MLGLLIIWSDIQHLLMLVLLCRLIDLIADLKVVFFI